jgi:hypothetical protein
MVWGPGRHGGIILSDNTAPIELVKLSTPSPFKLPWIFSYIGNIRFEVFVARLERARIVPHALLGGVKVNFKPFGWMELGASRTVVFGGDGRPSVGLEELWKIWWGRYDNPHDGEEDLSNQLAGFDWRFRLNVWGMGAVFYGEAIGEDEVNMFPYKWSTILGLLLAGLPPQGMLGLRIEWAHTHRVAYRHGTYGSGYTFKGELFGHHVDGDGKDVYLELALNPGSGVSIRCYVDWEARRQQGSNECEEEHLQAGIAAGWDDVSGSGLSFAIEYRFRRVRNAGYLAGEVRNEHFAGIEMSWRP